MKKNVKNELMRSISSELKLI